MTYSYEKNQFFCCKKNGDWQNTDNFFSLNKFTLLFFPLTTLTYDNACSMCVHTLYIIKALSTLFFYQNDINF